MNKARLFVTLDPTKEYVELDLSPDQDIQLTFQLNDLGDLSNQNNSFTKQFRVPASQKNLSALGFPNIPQLFKGTKSHWRKLPAGLIVEGFELIPFGCGYLLIDEFQSLYIIVSVYFTNKYFADALEGQIYDTGDSLSVVTNFGEKLVFSDLQHTWNVANMANSQSNTEGWIWPVIDYGAISYDPKASNITITVQQQRPALFLKTVIERFVKLAGYTIDYAKSPFLNTDIYQKLLIPFSNDSFEHGSDAQRTPDHLGMSVKSTQNQTLRHLPPSNVVNFQQVINDPSLSYWPQYNAYVATRDVEIDVICSYSLYFQGKATGTNPSTCELVIRVYDPPTGSTVDKASQVHTLDNLPDGTIVNGFGVLKYKTFASQSFKASFILAKGESVAVNFDVNNSQGTGVLYAGATFVVQSKETTVLYGQDIQAERILPDTSIKDFLKDILQAHGLTVSTNEQRKSVAFISYKTIIDNIPVAKDWSDKVLNMGDDFVKLSTQYGQLNNLKYQVDDAVYDQNNNKKFCDDYLQVDDNSLNLQKDLFTRLYSPTLNTPFIGGSIAQILKIDKSNSDQNFSVGTQPRILVDQKINLQNYGKKVTITDGSVSKEIDTIISVPYFYKPDGQYNLAWCDFTDSSGKTMPGLKSTYYPEIQKIMLNPYKVTRFFVLQPIDLVDLDLSIPIYLRQDNTYYYINKIDSFSYGHPVKVELIAIS